MAKPSSPGASSTDAVHAGVPRLRPHHALAPAIVQSATFTFASTVDAARARRGDDGRLDDGRLGNPTVREVEQRLAALEGTDDALLFSSGMAAITTAMLALTRAGDHVVLFRDCYRRTRQFVSATLGRFGVSHSIVPEGDLAALTEVIHPRTRLVVSEAPSSPFLGYVDLEALSAVCRAQGRDRPRLLVDATFASPANLRAAALGADLIVHNAAAYLAGHHDVGAGVLCGPGPLVGLARDLRGLLGATCDPHAAFLVGRGLTTLSLRVARQNATALAVAIALDGHPKVERVFYPFLPSHPAYAVATRQMLGGGGVVSLVVRGGREAASRLVDACRLATIAPAVGGVATLVEQPAAMSYAELDDEQLAIVGVPPGLVRLAVGIEETSDVLTDLLGALKLV